MTRRSLFAFLSAPAAASAQIANPNATLSSATHKALMLTPNGPMAAEIGAGLTVTAQPGRLVLSAQSGNTQPAPRVKHVPVIVASDGSITVAGLVTLLRTGIMLTEGADFARTATGAQLTGQGWSAGENWSALVEV